MFFNLDFVALVVVIVVVCGCLDGTHHHHMNMTLQQSQNIVFKSCNKPKAFFFRPLLLYVADPSLCMF